MTKKELDYENMFPCQLPHIKLSCYGCCGRDWKSKKEILEDLKKNTKDFKAIRQKSSSLSLLMFRDRLSYNPDDLTPSGLCSNVVDFGKGCVACPLHPKINDLVPKDDFLAIHKKDLRINHCDENYECTTFLAWKNMSLEERKKFVDWIEKQNYDHHDYSVDNVFGEILRKFEKDTQNN